MKSDILIVIVPIIIAVVFGYVITHDMFVYKAENDAVWAKRSFDSYMTYDCQALQDKINKVETDDYWFNSPSQPLIKAQVEKCQGEQ